MKDIDTRIFDIACQASIPLDSILFLLYDVDNSDNIFILFIGILKVNASHNKLLELSRNIISPQFKCNSSI